MAETKQSDSAASNGSAERLQAVARSLEREVTPEKRKEILSERAKALAVARSTERQATRDVLAFRVGGERYAVLMEEIDEVLEIKGLAPLLGAPRQLLGAILARARVLPVLDLRQLLGLEGGGMSDLTKVVVVGTNDDLFGLAVEEVEGKRELVRDGWVRPAAGPFHHVTSDRLAVLDLSQLGESSGAKT